MLGIPGPLVPLPAGLLVADRWEIGAPLRAGHCATYRAVDRVTRNEVAVKLLAAMPFDVDLARVEAQVAPLRVLDAVFLPRILGLEPVRIADRSAVLMIQELLRGESLADRVARLGPLPEDEARALGRRLLEILRHLARLDPPVVHGDLAPANLLVREGTGGLALVDWAAPKAAARDWTTQVYGPGGWSLAVDRDFAAPEIAVGCPSPRSDLYGAGACIAFALTGHSPDALRELDPRRVLDQALARCEVPAGLAALLVRLLDPTVETRLPTPQQALEALRDPAALARAAGAPRSDAEKPAWQFIPDRALGQVWSTIGVAAATLPAVPLFCAAGAALVPAAFGMTDAAILARLGVGLVLAGLGGFALRAGLRRFAAIGRTRLAALGRCLRIDRGAGWEEIPWPHIAAAGRVGPLVFLDASWSARPGEPARRRRLWLAPVYALDAARLVARFEEAMARAAALAPRTPGAPTRALQVPFGAVVAAGLALLAIAALGHRWGAREPGPDEGRIRRPPAQPDEALAEAAAASAPGTDPGVAFTDHGALATMAAMRPPTTPEEARQEALDALAPHARLIELASDAQLQHVEARARTSFETALAEVLGRDPAPAPPKTPIDLTQAVAPLAPEPPAAAPAAPPPPAAACPAGFAVRSLCDAALLPPACWDGHGTVVHVAASTASGAFLIDWTEVTVADYAACVADGACTLPGEGTGCFGRSTAGAGMPVNCVDRIQAEAWCAWADRRLCSVEEHVRAATGPGGAPYPWGAEPADCDRAIRDGRGTPGASSAPGCGRGGPWPVGSRPAGVSPVGALDLSGNLAEWVVGSGGGAAGGSYMDKAPEELRADGLRPIPADLPLPDVGFRCCLDAAPTP